MRCLRGSLGRATGAGACAVNLKPIVKGLSIAMESRGMEVTTRSTATSSGGLCAGATNVVAGPGDCGRAGGPTLAGRLRKGEPGR